MSPVLWQEVGREISPLIPKSQGRLARPSRFFPLFLLFFFACLGQFQLMAGCMLPPFGGLRQTPLSY